MYNIYIYLHLRSGDSQGQETFLAPSADKQTEKFPMEINNKYSFRSFHQCVYNNL